MENYPKRKRNRLPGFDYSTPNAYFLTICSAERRNLFWETVGATSGRPNDLPLTTIGKTVQEAIMAIPVCYPAVKVEHYVVMPNHIHILLRICADECGRPLVAPTVSRVVKQLKGIVSKQYGSGIWQKGFHDHVVRTEDDYKNIWQYIDGNPTAWQQDCFFIP